jgi:hypothetical protein
MRGHFSLILPKVYKMAVFRVVLKRTVVSQEYYIVEADDEMEAIEIAQDENFYYQAADKIDDDVELLEIDEIE